MKTKKMKPVFLFILIFLSLSTTVCLAKTNTKVMTAYNQCTKSKNYLYCTNGISLFKVNNSNNNVQKLKTVHPYYAQKMHLKGNYLYYIAHSQGSDSSICRINVNTGKYKRLASNINSSKGFVIYNSNIYYSKEVGNKSQTRVMKLTGKANRKTNSKIKCKVKDSNVNNYYVIDDRDKEEDDWWNMPANYYLVTPTSRIFLENSNNWSS